MDRSAMSRFEAFGDGVFAIVITLLVLELRLPEAHDADTTLASRLLSIWPSYAAYLVSFLFLAFWWLVHHGLLDSVRVMDGPLIWMNFLFLMLTSLIPFAASLASEHWGEPVTGVLYGINLFLALLVSRAFYGHVLKTPEVQSEPPDPEAARTEKRAYIFALSLLALGVVLGFVSAVLSFVVYGVMAVFYVVTIWKGRVGLAAAQRS